MSINGEEIIVESEPIPEPTTETGGREDEGETIDELEDRLVTALNECERSNSELRSEVEGLKQRIDALESRGSVPEPGNSNTPTNPLDTPTGERQPDIPPRSSNIWFRKWGE